MSVVIETTLGDITVDLYLEQRPVTCLNFLKLCKMKYYNFNLFHTIRNGFIAQTGDPSGEGSGGESIFGLLEGPQKRFFSGEKMPKIRHTDAGLLSMVCTDDMMVGSQFFFTLGTDLDSLDGVHCVIGEVTEGHEVLRKLNEVICDESHRPYQDVRITHTVILEDPFNDPSGFRAPSRSPSPSAERLKGGRIAPDEELDETQGKSASEIQEIIEEKEAKARATILEIVGDLPDADIAPPENVLFVCKLNPVTTDEDLEIIFSRFGKIVSCEVIRDKKTGDSLQYAFIEFSDKKSCEDAYFKMDNVLIDDRRIHVDFSQSVSKMRWLGKGRGVQHFNDDEIKDNHMKSKSKTFGSEDRRDRNSNRHHENEKYKTNRYGKRGDRERQDRNSDRKKDFERNQVRRRENSTDKRRDHYEERDERRKKKENEPRINSHRERSRSKSPERPRNKREKSRERSRRERNDYNNDNGPTKSDKEEKHKKNEDDSNNKRQKESHSNSHRSKYESPSRSTGHRHNNNDKLEDASSRRNHNDTDEKINSHRKRHNNEDVENSKANSKKRQNEASESSHKTKRLKKDKTNHKGTEPRTPSPVSSKSNSQNSMKQKKKLKKVVSKKKRKHSTTTDSDSSDSSSSSESSSSTEEDRKKRSKRKRKLSTSSSSDSSDSSSSTSSSTDSSSSDTTSSSSSDERHKKRKKSDKRKVIKKSRKKS